MRAPEQRLRGGGRGRTASERASGGGRGAGEGRGEDGGARAGPRPRHRPLLALRERGRAPGRTAALPACEAARSGPFLPACSWLVQSGGPDVCFSLIRRPRSTGCTPPLLGRNFLLLKEKRLPGGAALAGDPSARGDRGGSIGASSRSARDAEGAPVHQVGKQKKMLVRNNGLAGEGVCSLYLPQLDGGWLMG